MSDAMSDAEPVDPHQGKQGKQGEPGERGNQGNRGNPGEQGIPGVASGVLKLTDRRVLYLFAVAVLAFTLLSIRQAHIANEQTQITNQVIKLAHQQQVIAYMRCTDIAANTVSANKFGAAMADLERHNQFIRGQIRTHRVRLYEGLIFPVPNCGAKP